MGGSAGGVSLEPLDEDHLELLVDAAVTGADPAEVMPAVGGTRAWSPERRDAFRAFSRQLMATMHLVMVEGQVVGMIRMAPTTDPDVVETGSGSAVTSAAGASPERRSARSCAARR